MHEKLLELRLHKREFPDEFPSERIKYLLDVLRLLFWQMYWIIP
jgi:hypothetical protein